MAPSIVRKLAEKLSKVHEHHPSINHGGCGLFALYLAGHLNNLGIKCELVLIADKDRLRDYHNDLEAHGKVYPDAPKPAHVMVKVGRTYVDAEGAYSSPDYWWPGRGYKHIKVPVHAFEDAINSEDGWNDTFDRWDHTTISNIKRLIREACKMLGERGVAA